eukprot:1812128-Pleurochrysis_carterae.AAC.1
MATPSSERASEKFSGAGRGGGTRARGRAVGSAANQKSAQPAPVWWAELGLAAWRKVGALSSA